MDGRNALKDSLVNSSYVTGDILSWGHQALMKGHSSNAHKQLSGLRPIFRGPDIPVYSFNKYLWSTYYMLSLV